jgi:DnaJ-class molecular chaperone
MNTQSKYTPSPYAYRVPAPRMACPECKGVGALWPAGELRAHRCESCGGHGQVTRAGS